MRCYLAAPLFTAAERAWNSHIASELRAALPDWTFLVPQEFCAGHDQHQASGGRPDFAAIYRDCLDHLAEADCVLAVLDGPDPDSGTCFEAGWAVARGQPVIGLRTDWRPAEDGAANCMLTRSCVAVVRTVSEAIAALQRLGR